tara:strand:+ start:11240 stop:12136 length:897 start_codon:yes stop_codon:yes gene_type:complete
MSDIYWGTHAGGFGATNNPILHILYYSYKNNKKIIHNCDNEFCKIFKDTVIHKFLLDNSEYEDNTELFLKKCFHNYPNHKAHIYNSGFLSIRASYENFNNSILKKKIYNAYKERSIINNWKLNYNKDKSIIIHVRLWDEAPSNLTKKRVPTSKAHQSWRFIGENNLIKLLMYLNKNFKEHKLMICTTPNIIDINICKDIINKTNITCEIISEPQEVIMKKNPKVFGGDGVKEIPYICGDEEYDIWKMINCDILIMAPSTFSIFAGFLHQGTKVYLPSFHKRWRHFYDLGFTNKNILNI